MDCRTRWPRSCCSPTGSQPYSGRGKHFPPEDLGNDTPSSGRAAEGTHGGIQCSLGSKGERVWLVGMPQDLLVMEKIITVCICHEHPLLLLPLATIKLRLCTLLLQGDEGVGAAGRCQLLGTTTPQAPPSLGAWFA